MKRLIAFILCAVLTAALLILSACGEEKKDKKAESAVSAEETTFEESSAEETTQESASAEESSEDVPAVKELDNLEQYIDIGTYVGVQMGEKAVLTDKIVETVLNHNYLSEKATLEAVTDRGAVLNDTVVIDFKGYFADSGEEIEGSASDDVTVVLGSGTFIEGFEEAIVGHKAGERFEIVVSYPDDYFFNDYAGKAAKFDITLDAVKETVYPQPTEEIAKELGFDSLDKLMEAVNKEAEESVYAQNIEDVWKAVLDNAKVKSYPAAQVKAYTDQYSDYYTGYYSNQAVQAGVELEEYIKLAFGMTLKEFNEDLTKTATEYGETMVKEELCMYIILDKEFGREIDPREYNEMVEEKTALLGISKEELEEKYGVDMLEDNIRWDKVKKYLYENAVFGTVTQ